MKSFVASVVHTLVASLLFFASTTAFAIPFGTEVGPVDEVVYSEGFNLSDQQLFGNYGWIIGSPENPQGITASLDDGMWQKYLYTDANGNPFEISQGFVFYVAEVLWATNEWSSWHEAIGTDGWQWVPDQAFMMTFSEFEAALGGATPTMLSGLTTDLSANGTILNFEFDPLSTSSIDDALVVFKQIACTAADGCLLGNSPETSIRLLEYPGAAIPEPMTLTLMGAGLLAMFGRRRLTN